MVIVCYLLDSLYKAHLLCLIPKKTLLGEIYFSFCNNLCRKNRSFGEGGKKLSRGKKKSAS